LSFVRSIRDTLSMIRFSHSVFALPFALFALFLAAGGWPSGRVLLWVLVAMVAARSAAMGMNRLADRRFDAANPRTANRELVTGALSVRFVGLFTLGCALAFVFAAWRLNDVALLLSPLVLLVLFGYSFLKRFTALAHFGVGLALGLSPLGAWIAVRGADWGDLRIPVALGAGVLSWVAGFDVIYACQDAEVDRELGLHSIPARLGVQRALQGAALLHVLCVLAFAAVAPLAGLGWAYLGAVCFAAVILLAEHSIVSPADLSRVNAAFFTANGIVAVILGAAGIADVLL
jgi:4-hydroxybenzoate polyprenyltransferase